MIKLTKLLSESVASDQAQKLGLDYLGFGRYGKNGKTTHVSLGGKKLITKNSKQTQSNNTNSQFSDLKNRFKNLPDDHYKEAVGDRAEQLLVGIQTKEYTVDEIFNRIQNKYKETSDDIYLDLLGALQSEIEFYNTPRSLLNRKR